MCGQNKAMFKITMLKEVDILIIDMHTHIWGGHYEAHSKDLLKACELYGISKIYVSGISQQYPDEDAIHSHNSDIYRFMHENRQLAEGYCYVNPRNTNSLDVLKQGIEAYGMSGMKLWIATYCDDPLVFPLIEKCIDYNVPVLIHSFHKAVGQLEDETVGTHVAKLAQKYSEAKLIMAHLGGNAYHGIKAIRGYPNVWVDLSGSLFRRDEMDYTIKQIGVNRILFGSDMPGCTYLLNYGQIEEADISSDEKEMIFFRNTEKIFNRNYRL